MLEKGTENNTPGVDSTKVEDPQPGTVTEPGASDGGVSAKAEDTSAKKEGSVDEGKPVNWEKRYKDLQGELTTKSQKLAQLEKVQKAEEGKKGEEAKTGIKSIVSESLKTTEEGDGGKIVLQNVEEIKEQFKKDEDEDSTEGAIVKLVSNMTKQVGESSAKTASAVALRMIERDRADAVLTDFMSKPDNLPFVLKLHQILTSNRDEWSALFKTKPLFAVQTAISSAMGQSINLIMGTVQKVVDTTQPTAPASPVLPGGSSAKGKEETKPVPPEKARIDRMRAASGSVIP